MRGINHTRTLRHLIQFVDEDRAFSSKVVDDIAVMHDLLAHIDRRAEGLEGNLDDIDGSHHACAEAAGLEKKNSLGFRFVCALANRSLVKSGCSHIRKYTASTRRLEQK